MSALCPNCKHPEHGPGECLGRASSFSGGGMACQCLVSTFAPAIDGLVPVEDALRDAIAEAKRQAAESNWRIYVRFLAAERRFAIGLGMSPDVVVKVLPDGSVRFREPQADAPARVHPTGTGR